MAEIFEITGKQSALFSSLDPYMLSALSGIGEIHTFVAVEELLGGDMPVGIATVSFEQETAVIYWLYVHVNYRFRGVGESFIQKICEIAGKRGIKEVAVRIPYLSDTEELPFNIEYYFDERGFVKKDTVYRQFWLDSDMLSELAESDETDVPGVVAIDDLSGHMLNEFTSKTKMRFGLSAGSVRLDKKVSCVCLDDKGNPLATLLFAKNNGVWFLAGSFSKDRQSAEKTLRFALLKIAGEMAVRESVWMTDLDDNFAGAGEELLGGARAGAAESMDLLLSGS